MPKKKKSTKIARHKMIDNQTETLVDSVPHTHELYDSMNQSKRPNLWIGVGLFALVLFGIFAVKSGWVVAAVVNGRPIFRWDLNNVMLSRFGKQTMESLVSEALIADAAKKSNVEIGKPEIDAKEQEILQSFGGKVNIDELLKYQGITKADFDRQIALQLTVKKILGKDIQITDSDVDAFIATNRATLTATEPAALKEEAKQALMDQKVGEKLQPWFAELKDKAKILRFL